MSRSRGWSLLWALALAFSSSFVADFAHAGWRHGCGGGCGFSYGGCGPALDGCDYMATCAAPAVQEMGYWANDTIMVPHCGFKTVVRQVVTYRPVVRQKTITVERLVPEVRQVAKQFVEMVPEQRTRTEAYVSVTPQWSNVSHQVPVLMPHTVTRNAVRTVCTPIMVQGTETIYRDAGQCVNQCYVDACGCVQSCPVWMPNVVPVQVPVTMCKMRVSQVPYSYDVTVCRPQMKTIVERVCKPIYTTKTREVAFMQMVPRQVQHMVSETFCRPVQENRVVEYCALVAQNQQVEELIPVTTMVPQQVRRWVCGPSVMGKGQMNAGAPPADAPLAP